ncbi:putative transporter [compost metagenome]
MFVVAQQTFAWASLRVLGKVPLHDALVIFAVTIITVFTDLATAVLCGIVIAALNFAWQQARELYADSHLEADGSKLYRLHGTLFFASSTPFLNQFDVAGDPAQVTLDCRHLSFVDYSAIAALKTLRERYAKAGKHLRVLHLSERCKQLLKRAGVQHD